MKPLDHQIQELLYEALSQLAPLTSLEQLEQFRITYLARQGKVAACMEQLSSLSLEEKKKWGPVCNNAKKEIHTAYQEKLQLLQQQKTQALLEQDQHFDVTAYSVPSLKGTLHPTSHFWAKVCSLFISMGYKILEGPEVETEFYNFEALNIPANHPARDMWDTLWLDIPGLLLRTHTSPVQIHALQDHTLPFAAVAPGRVFRHEATDATHDFMFNQLEGIVVDKNISMAHLLGTLQAFFRGLFLQETLEIRVRPGYFPFVEPGIEVDCSCPFCTDGCSVCKYSRWIELGGAGLIHPHVLQACTIDPHIYSGFAFGLGLDRCAMLMYGIPDIRLFTGNKIDFLKQFS